MLDNKVLGLALIFWLIIVGTALLVDIPMVLLNNTTQHRLTQLQNNQLMTQLEVRHLAETPTASPSAAVTETPTPTVYVSPLRKVVTPVKPVVTSTVK